MRAGLAVAPVDLSLLAKGDGGTDLLCSDWRLQVKTRGTSYNQLLVQRVTEAGRLRGLQCDAYVSAEWTRTDREVLLLGWIRALDFSEIGRVRRSTRGRFWNLTMPDRLLLPMADLRTELECH